jgi:hypothetical protein
MTAIPKTVAKAVGRIGVDMVIPFYMHLSEESCAHFRKIFFYGTYGFDSKTLVQPWRQVVVGVGVEV